MVDIHHLDVTFDVEEEGDAAVFARLFARHIEAWSRREEERRQSQHAAAAERSLGDRPVSGSGGGW